MSSKNNVKRLKKLNVLGSIRAKYIATFALLISIVVLLISIIISSTILNFVTSTRFTAVDGSSKLMAGIITELMESSGKSYDEVLEDCPEKIESGMNNIASMNRVAVIITDRIGNVEYSNIPKELRKNGNRVLPSDVLYKYGSETTEKGLEMSDLQNFYPQAGINSGTAIKDENGFVEGIVLVSAPTNAVEDFMHGLIQTLIMSFIWITIAAVVIAVFISERIVSPLKIMEKAAKGVAVGNYDIRVPEQGVDTEIADIATAFNEMSRVVKEKEIIQRNFLGSVSHDMRTPMTSMAGFVDGILDGTIPPEKHEYYLKIVSAETHRLSRLVNSLLDITRIQSGERKFNKCEFDMCELLRLILISMEKQIDDKKIEVEFLTCRDKCMVYSDSDGIHQVAYNLIHNALKFTDEGGLLRISIEEGKNKTFIVSVYNTGKGISSDELPYIFDRFFKADPSRGLDKSGAGLGLFIVKTILTSLGETVSAESEEGKYCSFSFTVSGKPNDVSKIDESTKKSTDNDDGPTDPTVKI